MQGHRKHVAKLEQIVRLMDNDLLDPDKIDEVRHRFVCVCDVWVGGGGAAVRPSVGWVD